MHLTHGPQSSDLAASFCHAASHSPGSQTPVSENSSHHFVLDATGSHVPRARQANTKDQQGLELPPPCQLCLPNSHVLGSSTPPWNSLLPRLPCS